MSDDPEVMPVGEQCSAFVGDINRVIDRYRAEFNIPVAAVIGSLEMVKLEIFTEAMKQEEQDEE